MLQSHPKLSSMSCWTGEAAQSTRLDDPRPSGPRARPSPASGSTSRWYYGQRRRKGIQGALRAVLAEVPTTTDFLLSSNYEPTPYTWHRGASTRAQVCSSRGAPSTCMAATMASAISSRPPV